MSNFSEWSPMGVTAGYRNIDPRHFPIGIAGRGPDRLARRSADPLEVNALLLRSSSRRCLLVSFDLLYVGRALEDKLLPALHDRYGLARPDVLLFASHTHFAPSSDPSLSSLGACDDAYVDHVAEMVLDLADELHRAPISPYRLEVGQGPLQHSVNRRRPRIAPTFTFSAGLSLPRVTLAPHEGGPRDDTATVVRIAGPRSGTPLAMIWHYACHPVAHEPADVTSAEFPGAVRESLRRAHGQRLPVLFVQGFCGDIRPNIRPRPPATWTEALVDRARFALTGEMALATTETAWQDWASSLAAAVNAISLAEPLLVDASMELASAYESVPISSFFTGDTPRLDVGVWGVRLGTSMEVLAISGEPSIGWQDDLASTLNHEVRARLYCGYCGDVFGYLPTPKQLDEGGYEVVNFQRLFGMDGCFTKTGLAEAITGAIGRVAAKLTA